MNSVDKAKKAANGDRWTLEAEGEVEVEADEEPLLDKDAAKLYRSIAARLNYLAPDRPDMALPSRRLLAT